MRRLPGSAVFGAAVWAALAVGRKLEWADLSLIEVLFLFAPLVVVPLGMKLASMLASPDQSLFFRLAAYGQPVAAIFAGLSFFCPAGQVAAALAAPWLLEPISKPGTRV